MGPMDSAGGAFVGRKGRASRATPRRIASLAPSGEPRLQRHLRSRRVFAPEELKTFPARGADAAPAADQRMLRKQRRLDRKDVIARDVPDGVDAFEDNVQQGRVVSRKYTAVTATSFGSVSRQRRSLHRLSCNHTYDQ
jgi:hypothetical protein